MDINQNPIPSQEYRKQNIILKEGMIEIHHNPMITKRCFNIRVITYDGYADMNLTEGDLLEICKGVLDFIEGSKND